jgi:hypothetical protein
VTVSRSCSPGAGEAVPGGAGVPLEQISQLVGHSGSTVTDLCTGTSCGRSFRPARSSWTSCSAGTVDKQIDKQDRKVADAVAAKCL